ncbi:unnamed protein product (macronuclear) [Paramecium tetraurelia]|uniref:Serine aminopeptidase S33 domain-containing protein n=2 Tax=Paramecium tetraurelia TaxID=5888 RepID=A0BDS8_PARTE|nr:uncharacterized protein GSPATT00027725001 [Paramecium tetraurelia]CAK56695.1 unnamed protein product [Paramecium tetraurelia]|eukprot:XP_001424093.1 hypothetical protein (macronuclear) [Paramecium tetraurelia strain d4-2]
MDIKNELYYEDTHSNDNAYDHILVLIHGNLITCKYWKRLIQQIQQVNSKIRCISMDLRGFGRSQSNQNVDQITDLSNDVDILLKSLLSDKNDEYYQEHVFLAGWSLGGIVGMQLAVDYPNKYQKLILIASGSVCGYALMREDEEGQVRCQTKQQVKEHPKVALQQQKLSDKDREFMKMFFDKVLFNSGKYPEEQEYKQLLDETFLQTQYTNVCWALNQFDISSGGANKASQIKGPVLIYHGELDIVIPKVFAEGNAKEIGEEKCTLIIRPGVGHMPPIEDVVNLALEISRFIN